MNTISLIPLAALFAVTAFAQPAPGPAAHWEGSMHMPNREVRVTVDLARKSTGDPKTGEWIGSVSIPDAGVFDAPLGGISIQDTVVRFSITGLSKAPIFDGKLSEDGSTLTGTATSDKGSAPFTLERSGEASVKVPPPSTSLAKEFEGNWEGTLDVPTGRQLHAVLKLARDANGTATGTLISVDEGGQEFAVTTIAQQGKQLQFEIRVIGAKYTGLLSDSGGEIAGEYTLPGIHLPLTFKRAAGSGHTEPRP